MHVLWKNFKLRGPVTKTDVQKLRILVENCSSRVGNNEIKLPPEPTSCCMSGCANCVWIKYAEELCEIFQDGGEKANKIILDKVTDPNMRAYLNLELRNLQARIKANKNNNNATNKGSNNIAIDSSSDSKK